MVAKSVLSDLNIPAVADPPCVGNNLQDRPTTSGVAAGVLVVPPGNTAPQLQLTFFPKDTEPQWRLEEVPQSRVVITTALLAPKARIRAVVKLSDVDIPVQVEPVILQATDEH
ncbi:hypothetical protein H310_14453 [Aphanomyces invadans]|uniref:Uncharacterized protein n=1 Tax=Aphanomyces invadans TaxID=157072 RepID=A0A024TC01_9STRA|nr:hypothetical protein H310_14453 [Aphanomyces invadans]ETV90857.1 hypothetical protein H310_14453 [Aphanomyces invadans]|eukprot:XP_008880535.1 hypothetical protein H310_14453 [Aphanomyces invadans]